MSIGKSNQFITTSKVLAGLLGVTIYQVAYRHIASRTLPAGSDYDELDEHCSTAPGSFQCTELLVFHRWQAQADAARNIENEQLELLVHEVAPRRQSARDDVSPASTPQSGFLAQKSPMEAVEERLSAFDKIYEETLTKLNAHRAETFHSPFEAEMDVLNFRYKEHEKKLYDIHERHHQPHDIGAVAAMNDVFTHEDDRLERMAKLEKLYDTTMADMEAHSDEKTDFETESFAELAALQGAQQRLALQHAHSHEKHTHSTTTAAPYVDPEVAREMAVVTAISHIVQQTDQSLAHKLCEKTVNRRLNVCREFLAPVEVAHAEKELASETATRHSMRVAQRNRLHNEVDEWQAHFAEHDLHLCEDARHYNSSHCRELRGSGKLSNGAVPSTPTASQPQGASSKGFLAASDDLQWSDVVSAGAKKWSPEEKKRGMVSYNKTDLRHLRFGMGWGGKIPKVVCIAPIPCKRTGRHLQHLVDNFKLQHYDGEKELLLVYRQQDAETAAIVKAYANGKDIRAIAAYDTHEFPSSSAFRYASWQARDADIVARWNYDEWYGPERLSMQVRALAASKRPLSLLKYWTVLAGSGKELMSTHGGPGWEGSIVGEAGWMRKHWMPMMDGERALLMDHYSHDIVQVDKPDLLVYNAESHHSSEMLLHFGVQDVV